MRANASVIKFMTVYLFGTILTLADFLSNFIFYICISVIFVNNSNSLIRSILHKILSMKKESAQEVQLIIEKPIKAVFHHTVDGVIA